MKILTPVRKVSFGLVMISVSTLLLAEWIGIIPSEQRSYMEARRILSESLAVQLSTALTAGETVLVQRTLETLVERDGELISAHVFAEDGRSLVSVGPHADNWQDLKSDRSTATHVQVPIFSGNQRWGKIQVVFTALPASSIPYSAGIPLLPLILFTTIVGFLSFLWLIKRTLRELDPSSVVPERVRSAFDNLSEGLVIIDEKENIILANQSFTGKINVAGKDLVGHQLSSIKWTQDSGVPPWKNTLKHNQHESGTTIRHVGKNGALLTFTVNTAPIANPDGKVRGALVTFNDLTDLERKQIELKQTVNALETSQSELQKKTVELEFLATRDSLTGCLNRRAFFEKAQELFDEARITGEPLGCIMTDIDHFKAINDNHGHAAGDKVIQVVAGELKSNARPDDIVGRYGGEEFCMFLPGLDSSAAIAIGERLRVAIAERSEAAFDSNMNVTASFGVALIDKVVADPAELISRADKALYDAKEGGRNCVVAWSQQSNISETNGPIIQGHEETVAHVYDEPTIELTGTEHPVIAALEQRVSELEAQLRKAESEHAAEVALDDVTGLPNRLLLIDRIRNAVTRSERNDRVTAVVILDIDLFRRINDALGIVIGDKVLRKVGEKLAAILRNSDTVSFLGEGSGALTVSRTGADEFGILLSDLESAEAVTWVVKRLLNDMSTPFSINGNDIFISCSAGISLFPHDATDPETLLGNASVARYTAKRRLGRNNFAFFAKDLNENSFRHLWIEGQMHNALENGEFSLNFQPKVDLVSGRITSMEGLLRWKNAKIGHVSPVDFIPVAEHTGLINEIGRWVVKQACEQLNCWKAAGFANISVAVNLSPVQFRQSDLVEQIVTALAEANIDPSMLELEVTESVIMENFDDSIGTLNELADVGIKISIDDFGTGYSSLAYLKNLPVHSLKIDRSFLSDTVPDEQDKQIIKAIIAMAHSMELKVIAEGVETEAQRAFLSSLSCDEMQGYLFSKPLPADEALAMLTRHNKQSDSFSSKKIA